MGLPVSRALVTLLFAPIAACQVLLDVEGMQCEVNSDCVGLFGRSYVCTSEHVCREEAANVPEPAPEPDAGETPDADTRPPLPAKWACLREAPREIVPIEGVTIMLRFVVTDFVHLTVPEGLVAKACDTRDISCTSPLIDNVTPDSEGYIVFPNLPHGWRGYTQLSAPDYVDSLMFTTRVYVEDAMPDGPSLLRPETLDEIAGGGGEDIDPSKGIAIITVSDCEGNAAEGVRFVQEDMANTEPPFYFEGTFPDRERQTTTITTMLTRSGVPLAVGGFSHIEPGYVSFAAILDETGDEVGQITVQIREHTMTYVEIDAGY
jgi:hypothetical protein